MTPTRLKSRLVRMAAGRYRGAGRFAYHFATGKLTHDPVFTALLADGLLAGATRILDLGCGQGLLAAWLSAAQASHEADVWCEAWPVPDARLQYRGVELMAADVDRGRKALGSWATIECGDIRSLAFGHSDGVVILDVLHYMKDEEQEIILRQTYESLSTGGRLILRIGDAAAGLRFHISQWVDAAALFGRGHGVVRLHCRTLTEWVSLLTGIGFHVKTAPMSAGTPFANVLLIATRP